MTKASENVTIKALRIRTSKFQIQGDTPYLQNKWTDAAIDQMRAKMAEGSQVAGKRKARAAQKV